MKTQFALIEKLCKQIEGKISFTPKIGVILGSGLGRFADRLTDTVTVDYASLDGFPTSTVKGHSGCFVFGKLGSTPLVIMKGRVHYYEGYDMQKVTLPIRLMAKLGVETLCLTCAAGGIGDDLNVGSLMLIRDHISSFVPSPLRGENDERIGTRFPDMSEVYDQKLREIAKKAANKLGIALDEGVYLQTRGPQYETPAEVLMYRALGADAVGMSTACEAIAARHAGMAVMGISLITNKATGLSSLHLAHEEVTAAASHAAPRFEGLLQEILLNLHQNH